MAEKPGQLLAIDIGNTTTAIGFFQGEKLVSHFRLASKHTLTADEAGVLIGHLRNHQVTPKGEIGGVIISSVVPFLTPIYQAMAQRYFGCFAMVVTCDLTLSVTIRTDDPYQVGADRIANAEGYVHQYDGPGIVVDFGTATTFDVISANREYLGGVISPGIETSSARLAQRAAQLFNTKLEPPPRAIGTNTENSLKSGILYGAVGQVEGITNRIIAELGGTATVIAPGGLAETIAAETAIIQKIDETLTLTGLRWIYEQNSSP
jgi:type III pantothenate kinase